MRYDFRKADMGDIQYILELFRRAVDYLCAQNIDQWDELYPDLTTLKNDIDCGHMYVLCEGKNIVAAVAINDLEIEGYEEGFWKDNGKAAVIHRLCVDPKHQGKGLGRTTMDYAEGLIEQEGYTSVRLDVFSQNPKAYQLYKKLGYDYTGEVTSRKGCFFLMEKILINI